MTPPHSTVPVKIGKKKVDIDEGISDLVYHLNKCGLATLSSCQQDPDGNSYLVFDYSHIRLASVVNTPHPVLLLKWRQSNRKQIHSDSDLSRLSEVIEQA